MNQNVFRSNSNRQSDDRTWSALDSDSRHPLFCNNDKTKLNKKQNK